MSVETVKEGRFADLTAGCCGCPHETRNNGRNRSSKREYRAPFVVPTVVQA